MIDLFVIGSIAFWLMLSFSFILLLFLVENEKSFWSMLVLIGTVAAFQFLGDLGLIAWVLANPLMFAGLCVGYLVAGGVWSFVKWYFFLLDKRDEFMETRKKFIEYFKRKSDTATDEAAIAVWTQVRKHRTEDLSKEDAKIVSEFNAYAIQSITIPKANERKSKIVNWMAYWPWSMLGALLTDFLRRVFNNIYNMLAGVFEKITQHVFRDVADEV